MWVVSRHKVTRVETPNPSVVGVYCETCDRDYVGEPINAFTWELLHHRLFPGPDREEGSL